MGLLNKFTLRHIICFGLSFGTPKVFCRTEINAYLFCERNGIFVVRPNIIFSGLSRGVGLISKVVESRGRVVFITERETLGVLSKKFVKGFSDLLYKKYVFNRFFSSIFFLFEYYSSLFLDVLSFLDSFNLRKKFEEEKVLFKFFKKKNLKKKENQSGFFFLTILVRFLFKRQVSLLRLLVFFSKKIFPQEDFYGASLNKFSRIKKNVKAFYKEKKNFLNILRLKRQGVVSRKKLLFLQKQKKGFKKSGKTKKNLRESSKEKGIFLERANKSNKKRQKKFIRYNIYNSRVSFYRNRFRKPFYRNKYSKPHYKNKYNKPFNKNKYNKPFNNNKFNKPFVKNKFNKFFNNNKFNKPFVKNKFNKFFNKNKFNKPFVKNKFNKFINKNKFNKRFNKPYYRFYPKRYIFKRMLGKPYEKLRFLRYQPKMKNRKFFLNFFFKVSKLNRAKFLVKNKKKAGFFFKKKTRAKFLVKNKKKAGFFLKKNVKIFNFLKKGYRVQRKKNKKKIFFNFLKNIKKTDLKFLYLKKKKRKGKRFLRQVFPVFFLLKRHRNYFFKSYKFLRKEKRKNTKIFFFFLKKEKFFFKGNAFGFFLKRQKFFLRRRQLSWGFFRRLGALSGSSKFLYLMRHKRLLRLKKQPKVEEDLYLKPLWNVGVPFFSEVKRVLAYFDFTDWRKATRKHWVMEPTEGFILEKKKRKIEFLDFFTLIFGFGRFFVRRKDYIVFGKKLRFRKNIFFKNILRFRSFCLAFSKFIGKKDKNFNAISLKKKKKYLKIFSKGFRLVKIFLNILSKKVKKPGSLTLRVKRLFKKRLRDFKKKAGLFLLKSIVKRQKADVRKIFLKRLLGQGFFFF